MWFNLPRLEPSTAPLANHQVKATKDSWSCLKCATQVVSRNSSYAATQAGQPQITFGAQRLWSLEQSPARMTDHQGKATNQSVLGSGRQVNSSAISTYSAYCKATSRHILMVVLIPGPEEDLEGGRVARYLGRGQDGSIGCREHSRAGWP